MQCHAGDITQVQLRLLNPQAGHDRRNPLLPGGRGKTPLDGPGRRDKHAANPQRRPHAPHGHGQSPSEDMVKLSTSQRASVAPRVWDHVPTEVPFLKTSTVAFVGPWLWSS